MDSGLLAGAAALAGGWLGGRAVLFGIVAGAVLALADFWLLSSRLDATKSDRPPAAAWILAAGFRLVGVAIVVAALFLTGRFHPVGLVIGLAALPFALIARGLRTAREGA